VGGYERSQSLADRFLLIAFLLQPKLISPIRS